MDRLRRELVWTLLMFGLTGIVPSASLGVRVRRYF